MFSSARAQGLKTEQHDLARSASLINEPFSDPEMEKPNGGRGVLLTGAPGVAAASVVILGGGVAGTNAAQIASGMGADVTVLDRNPEVLRRIAAQLGGRVRTLFSTREVVELLCRRADLVIATVLVPGATTPKLISAQMVKAMKPGTVIVDVAVDQGGCAETSRPTTHSHPTFVADNVVTLLRD
jgi:alanine dehydrogenase